MRYFSKIHRKHPGNCGKIRRYSPGLLRSFRRKPGDGSRKTARRRVEGGIFLGRFSEKGTGRAEDSEGISAGPFEKPARRQRRGTAFPPGMHSFSTGFSTEIRRAGAFVTHVGTRIACPVCRRRTIARRAIHGTRSVVGICLRQIAFVPNAGRSMIAPTAWYDGARWD